MDPGFARPLKYKKLMKYTNNFSEENFLGTFQFGKVYRGFIMGIPIDGSVHRSHFLMVKIWEVPKIYEYFPGDNEARVMLEVFLHQHERLNSQPGILELYGYCWESEHLGIVYEFKPLDIVHNLVPKDSFTWLQRIKVAIGLARLLKFLHTKDSEYQPFLVRNIAAAHIVVDEEYNPKLFDFGMIVGGIFPDRTIYEAYLYGCYGYIDPYIEWSGKWSEKTDVFAFGVLLLNLIAKRVYTEEERMASIKPIYYWAWDLYEPYGSDNDSNSKSDSEAESGIKKRFQSLVHQSLTIDSDFSFTDGRKITKLAMKCIDRIPDLRPTMKQVMKSLLKLQIVKKHAKFLQVGPYSPSTRVMPSTKF